MHLISHLLHFQYLIDCGLPVTTAEVQDLTTLQNHVEQEDKITQDETMVSITAAMQDTSL